MAAQTLQFEVDFSQDAKPYLDEAWPGAPWIFSMEALGYK